MIAKHTPGPWMVGEPDQNGQAIVCNDFIEICTCWHHSVGQIEKQMHHNASLISAAPDLLAALRSFVLNERQLNDEHFSGVQERLMVLARAAIAKAEGGAP